MGLVNPCVGPLDEASFADGFGLGGAVSFTGAAQSAVYGLCITV